MAMSIQDVLASVRAQVAREVIDEVRDETINLAINVLEGILLKMAPITGLDFLALSALPDIEELKQWQDFEAATMNFLCMMLGIEESWIWFEPVIDETGEPLGNGWSCSKERASCSFKHRYPRSHAQFWRSGTSPSRIRMVHAEGSV